MSKKRFKHRKLTTVYKFENTELKDQSSKIWEEIQEFQHEYANVMRKINNKDLTRLDIKLLALEAFDISQSSQMFIYLLCQKFGGHYSITEDEVYIDAIKKNDERGYYEKRTDKS